MTTTYVLKTADESVTSEASNPQDDDHLFLAVGAGETWEFEWHLLMEGVNAGDFNCAVAVPSGTSGWVGRLELAIAATSATAANLIMYIIQGSDAFSAPNFLLGGAGVITSAQVGATIRALVRTTNSGTVKLRWCQGTANATATTVKAGSYLKATQLTTSTGSVAVRKTSNESVTSSDVLQDDDELLVAVGVDEVWEIEWVLVTYGTNSGARDFKAGVSAPANTSVLLSAMGLSTAADQSGALSHIHVTGANTIATGLSASGFDHLAIYRALVKTTDTSGNVVLQWAQLSSGTPATVVKADSYVKATRLVPS